MKHKLLVLTSLFFAAIGSGYSQNKDNDSEESDYPQPTEDIAEFFVDGTKSMASNAIKLDLYNSFSGSAFMSYERKINQSISIEGGFGLSYLTISSVLALGSSAFGEIDPSKSLLYGVGCKFFKDQGAIDFGGYRGALFMHRNYYLTNPMDNSVTKAGTNSVLFQQGFQIIKAKILLLEAGYNVGLGFTTVKEGDPDGYISPVFIDGAIVIKLGVLI